MGICTKCGYLSAEGTGPGDPGEAHTCSDNKKSLMKGMAKLIYDIIIYADPASTTAQKNNAMGRIQTKRAWIEANAAELAELLG